MSIKKHFEEGAHLVKPFKTIKELTEGEVESPDFLRNVADSHRRFRAPLDYSTASNFVKFGMAEDYYVDSIKRIYNTFPYDGSLAEKQQWENDSSGLDLYLLENGYPRSTGYAIFNPASAWVAAGGSPFDNNYGKPATMEYISIKGGPNSDPDESSIRKVFPDSQFSGSANLYNTASFRESNLKIDGAQGNTVEFWMNKSAILNDDTKTKREVIFDLHNGQAQNSANYGRLRIELNGAAVASPFLVTYLSGAISSNANNDVGTTVVPNRFANQVIGSGITPATVADGNWHHYAFTFANSGTAVESKLYIDGQLNHTLTLADESVGEVRYALQGTIGALATIPYEAANGAIVATTGWGKLSGSLDDFRFWKTKRTSKEIGRNWYFPVGGGTNTDTSNTKLGVYFKFNEGITADASTDSTVLDYSGRISNGTWTGYSSNSRNTGSAFLSSSYGFAEFEDPIVHASHPSVTNFLNAYTVEGQAYDSTNNSAIFHSLPHWITEADERTGNTHLRKLTQIISSYFDTAFAQIEQLGKVKDKEYVTGSFEKPIAIMDEVLRSTGLVVPELFVDAEIIESITNRDEGRLYETELNEVKNLIYKNIYNNINYIYKSKGAEKSARNLIRCFGVDSELVEINFYSDNHDFVFEDDIEEVSLRKKYIDFHHTASHGGTIYNFTETKNTNFAGFVSGTIAEVGNGGLATTTEAEFIFPREFADHGQEETLRGVNTLLSSSLFGCHTPVTTTGKWAAAASDASNFQVLCVRESLTGPNSRNAKFMLVCDHGQEGGPRYIGAGGDKTGAVQTGELTSSYYQDVFDNQKWNFAVRIKPLVFPMANMLGSVSAAPDYIVEFVGMNCDAGYITEQFTLTASVGKVKAKSLISSAKGFYLGAHRDDFSGTLLTGSDCRAGGLRHWLSYLDNDEIKAHAISPDNVGVSMPGKNYFSFEGHGAAVSNKGNVEVPKIDTLVLNWDFNDVTGSATDGTFAVRDISRSGSTNGLFSIDSKYARLENILRKNHAARGLGFPASDTKNIADVNYVYSARKKLPESIAGADMTKVLTDEERLFRRDFKPKKYYAYVEKSMYNSISKEMLKMFSSIKDFNNLVGSPVNRYRQSYKALNKLRQLFFDRVDNTPSIEKYLNFYKWIDSSITIMVSQLLPASLASSEELRDVIESHVLERNKYRSKFPTVIRENAEFETTVRNAGDAPEWGIGTPQLPGSAPDQSKKAEWWKTRAERDRSHGGPDSSNSVNLGSGNSAVDSNRESIRRIAARKIKGLGYLKKSTPSPGRLYINKEELYTGGSNSHINRKPDFHRPFTKATAQNDGQLTATTSISSSFINNDPRTGKEKINHTIELNAAAEKQIPNDRGYSEDMPSGEKYVPFSFYSSSLDNVNYLSSVHLFQPASDITNIHMDHYGPDYQIPMQGPFTETHVGGNQHRHIPINTTSGSTSAEIGKAPFVALDHATSRPEAYKLMFTSNGFKLKAPDIPATLFRDETAKRPVNIRNIKTSSSGNHNTAGNYEKDYQIISTNGRDTNNRYFTRAQSDASLVFDLDSSNIIQNLNDSPIFLTMHDHAKIRWDNLQTDHVFVTRFSPLGAPETSGDALGGYGLDHRSSQYSIYSSINYRNELARSLVNNKSQDHVNQFGFDSCVVSSIEGSMVNDVDGILDGIDYQDDFTLAEQPLRGYSWAPNYLQNVGDCISTTTVRGFYYEPLTVGYKRLEDGSFSSAGVDKVLRGNQAAPIHKTNRNAEYYYDLSEAKTKKKYDNFFVQHQIPRSDLQYSWITGSAATGFTRTAYYFGFTRDWKTDRDTIKWLPKAEEFGNIVLSTTPNYGLAVLGSTYEANAYYVDFTGLNTVIVDRPDTVSTSTSSGANTLSSGIAAVASYSWISSYYRDYETFYNPDIWGYGTNTSIYADSNTIGVTATGKTLNAILLNRNGPYGYPTWKQIRTGETSLIARNMKKDNRISVASIRTESVVGSQSDKKEIVTFENFFEAPLSISRPTMLSETIAPGTDQERVSYSLITYPNNVDMFSATSLTNKAFVARKDHRFPLESYETASYVEPIYPASGNMFFQKVRERNNFVIDYWHSDRLIRSASYDSENSYGNPIPAQSIWSLDGQLGETGASTEGLRLVTHMNTGQNGEGELLNDYVTWHNGGYQEVTHSIIATTLNPRLGALYTRRAPRYYLRYDSKDDLVLAWHHASGAPIYEVTGAGEHNVIYDTYYQYSEELRAAGKDHSIVPEFRISDHMHFYTEEAGMDFSSQYLTGALSLTGSDISDSSQASFYKTYTNTDFMKLFSYIKDPAADSRESNVNSITLTCRALKKFIPYKGLQPSERTLQLATMFSQSYYRGGVLSNEGSNVQAERGANHIRPINSIFFAPGIMYNTIKSGIAVDYPVMTASFNMSHVTGTTQIMQIGKEEQLRRGVEPADAEHFDRYDHDTFMRMTQANHIDTSPHPRRAISSSAGSNDSRFDFRVPFEALIEPERYLPKTFTVVDAEGWHPSASLNVTSTFMPVEQRQYKLAVNNFLAETVSFFLRDGKLTSMRSLPESSFQLTETDSIKEQYKMRVYLSKDESSINTLFPELASGSWGQITGSSLEGSSSFFMYERPSAFGPPVHSVEAVYGSVQSAKHPRFGTGFRPYTPPYYDGHAYAEITFTPPVGTSAPYKLSDIKNAENTTVTYHRDPGAVRIYDDMINSSSYEYRALDYTSGSSDIYVETPANGVASYSDNCINHRSAMQLNSSLNLFSEVLIPSIIEDSSGKVKEVRKGKNNEEKAWVIQTKFETPIMDFSPVSASLQFISDSGPIQYTGESALTHKDPVVTTRGMWHQHASASLDSDVGVKLFIDDSFIESSDIAASAIMRMPLPTSIVQQDFLIITDSSGNRVHFVFVKSGVIPADNVATALYYVDIKTTTELYDTRNALVNKINSTTGNHGYTAEFFDVDAFMIFHREKGKVGNNTGLPVKTRRSQFGSETNPLGRSGVRGAHTVGKEYAFMGKNTVTYARGFIQGNQSSGLTDPASNAIVSFGSVQNVFADEIGVDHTRTWAAFGDEPRDGARFGMSNPTGSLAKLVGFETGKTKESQVGQLATSKTVYEAVVAIPFVDSTTMHKYTKNKLKPPGSKFTFFKIHEDREEAMKVMSKIRSGSTDDLDPAIVNMVEKMSKYVFPPTVDFINNENIEPFYMFMFEFSHKFDRQDLADMWQNVLPSGIGADKIEKVSNSLTIRGIPNILNAGDQLQWMVFKVKQKAEKSYHSILDKSTGQEFSVKSSEGHTSLERSFQRTNKREPAYSFNWPYDFFSIVELIKIEETVEFNGRPEAEEVLDGKQLEDGVFLNEKIIRSRQTRSEKSKKAESKINPYKQVFDKKDK